MAKRKCYKVGDKFRVKTQVNNYCPDTTYVINQINGSSYCGTTEDGRNIGQWLVASQMKRLENNKAELETERKELADKLAEVDAKLKYMADNNLETYCETEFKIYQALTVMDGTNDKMERTRQLAKLMKDL